MSVTLSWFKVNKQMLSWVGLALLLLVMVHPAFAAPGGASGALPFENSLNKLQELFTGTGAQALAVIGLAGAGATLIFGNDLSSFIRSLLYLVLVTSLLVGANSFVNAIKPATAMNIFMDAERSVA